MRNEREMMDLILGTARQDERIRAVIMGGSRNNPNVKPDIFQDYDIIYVVRDMESFTSDPSWVDRFGERVMMQMPEGKVLPPSLGDGRFVYLMQFNDGNRIDLTLIPQKKMKELITWDSLMRVLLDKDGVINSISSPSDKDFHIHMPTEKEFQDCCNEYWWICLNISKGLWREELTYAKFMYEQINRNVLIRMLEWYIGTKTNFSISAGKFGKSFKHVLSQKEWEEFVSTYSDADYENMWDALFKMCSLFRRTAAYVANELHFTYPIEDDKNVTAYLNHVRGLPKHAIDFGDDL